MFAWMRESSLAFTLVLIGTLFAGASVNAASHEELRQRIFDADEYLRETMEAADTKIPQDLIKKARGIIIMRQYKFGFIFGARGGHGVALARDEKTGEWSAPAFVKTGEGSFGFQFGGQAVDTIYLIMNRKGMEILDRSRFRIGGDLSVAAGPFGRDGELKFSPETAILAYSRSKGLFAGAAFEGGWLWEDREANASFYNKEDLRSHEILFKRNVPVPSEARPLIQTLEKYSRKAPITEYTGYNKR